MERPGRDTSPTQKNDRQPKEEVAVHPDDIECREEALVGPAICGDEQLWPNDTRASVGGPTQEPTDRPASSSAAQRSLPDFRRECEHVFDFVFRFMYLSNFESTLKYDL